MSKFILLCSLYLLATLSTSAAERPNIIFFLTDDQRFDFLGCAGHPIVQTPNIDKLATEGCRFENMFVTTPTCWISRASILTGMYMRKHRFAGGTIKSEFSATAYPAFLKKAGYNTAYIGKSHFSLVKEHKPMFDVFTVINRNPYFKKMPDGSLRHETELCADKAIEFINKQKKETPFFVAVNFNASHAEDRDKKDHFPYPKAVAHLYKDIKMPLPKLNDPKIYENNPEFMRKSMHRDRYHWRWDTPEKYQHNMRNYLRMASGIDRVIGRVQSSLKEKGFADNTIIIYSADNGYYAADRGFAGKWTHYDEALRVPLVIYDPRQKENRGKVPSQMALNIDISATILDYAGIATPKAYNGRSLKEIVAGKKPSNWRTDTLGEFFSHHSSIPNWEGIRGERFVYAKYVDQDYEFLHDLQKDPNQLTNHAQNPEYKAILEKMRQRLKETTSPLGKVFEKGDLSRKKRRKK